MMKMTMVRQHKIQQVLQDPAAAQQWMMSWRRLWQVMAMAWSRQSATASFVW